MYEMRPEGLDFLEIAPLRLVFAGDLAAPPKAVFDAVASDVAGWPQWYAAVTTCEYAGDGPYGVGTRRRVKLAGGAAFHETVIAWDDPNRYAYRIDRSTVPGIRAMVEQWELLETDGGTRVAWTIAVDASTSMRGVLRAMGPGMGVATRKALARLDQRLAAG